jgi:ABC-2 type transport system permease protein
MRNTWAVCKREFGAYFSSPIGYVVVGVFALISGLGFTASFLFFAKITESPAMYAYPGIPDFEETFLSQFLVFCAMLMMFIGPLVTMRLLAEEKNRGTIELLLTYPLRDREIIFGKYLAALGMVLIMLLVVVVYLVIVSVYVDVEPAVLVFGLFTVFLTAAAFFSMGLFVSALTSNQITAGTLTFGLWFVMWILGRLGADLPVTNPAPLTWSENLHQATGHLYTFVRGVIVELPLDAHAGTMAQGVFQLRDVAYYLLVIAFFLFLTFRALESRKWRA